MRRTPQSRNFDPNRRPRVACVGSIGVDLVGGTLRSMPEPGRTALTERMSLHTGGCALNAAIGLARLGVPVELVGKVGDDVLGDFLVNTVRAKGVGTRHVATDVHAETSATMVMVDADSERRFVHAHGANATFTEADVDDQLLEQSDFLLLSGALALPGIDGPPTTDLLHRAKNLGVTTLVDVIWDATGAWMDTLQPSLKYIDYFLPSLPEAQQLTGKSDPEAVARALLAEGVGTVGVTMGVDGALFLDSDGRVIRAPSFRVDAVDTTGAGDAFCAGFIAGLAHGWGVEQAAKLASAVGAITVTEFGATAGAPTLDEALHFMDATRTRPPTATTNDRPSAPQQRRWNRPNRPRVSVADEAH